MLAGVGLDLVARHPYRRSVVRATVGVFAGAAVFLALLWMFASSPGRTLSPFSENFYFFRTVSYFWPAVSAIFGLFVAGALWVKASRRRRVNDSGHTRGGIRAGPGVVSGRFGRGWWAAVLLIACETTFLLVFGYQHWNGSSATETGPTEAVLAAKAEGSIVGFGTEDCISSLYIPPELNDELGVHELAAYDPMLPQSYYAAWKAASGTSAEPVESSFQPRSLFCPAITTTAVARLFGVSLVVTPHGTPGPSGAEFDGTFGKIDLYRIPGASVSTLSPLGRNGSLPPPAASETPVAAVQPYPGAWKVTTGAEIPEALRLRVTDVPGWHATLDGRPIALKPFDGIMLQTKVPAGHHTIVLTYWPSAFTLGLILAGLSAGGVVLALVIESRRHRRGTHSPTSAPV